MKISVLKLLPVACLLMLWGAAANAAIAEHVARSRTAGLDLLVYPTGVRDVVTITGSLPAGDAFAGGNSAVPTLTGMLLDRGTTRRDQFAIAEALEAVGATITFSVDTQVVGIRARCLRKDLPLVIDLLAEELRQPAFSEEQFERVRQQLIGAIKMQTENTGYRAGEALGRALFPAGHPNHPHSIDEILRDAAAARSSDVREFYSKHYGPSNMILVFVGDVNAREVQSRVGKAFGSWSGGVAPLQPQKAAAVTSLPAGDAPKTVVLKGKTSVSVIFGQPTGLRYRDEGALALRLGTAVLGSGFTGRLMSTVRDREGLTYGIDAQMAGDTFNDGSWQVEATFAPALLGKGIESTRREIRQWWQGGVTQAEVDARKQSLIGTFEVSLSTTRGLANALLTAVQRGYDARWLDEYPQRIRALTVGEVNAAIKRFVDPERLVLVEAGTLP